MISGDAIELVRQGDVLVVIPQRDLGALAELDLEPQLDDLLLSFERSNEKHVLVDFAAVPYFGSMMVSVLIRLWRTSEARGGKLVLANLSPKAAEVLEVMKLGQLWPTYPSRQAALEALAAGA